ncbi:hypothetical protein INT48_005000 [Thamnidium elegans]|uniref:Chitin-binding type-2 domain-containing protein n=1 Tax=Thamnidium elegans TaxID=101142 RepID=A0A8H7SVW5_9FUNG|nr:hypothetical protein INT48_005000 [Thamnidium elegans]
MQKTSILILISALFLAVVSSNETEPVFCEDGDGQPITPQLFAADNNCESYHDCLDGAGERKTCPQGLAFNVQTRSCTDPELVDCNAKDRYTLI